MSSPTPHCLTCPICTLPSIKSLGPSLTSSQITTIQLENLDFDILTTLTPKCELCKMLVDSRDHWQSDRANEKMPLGSDGFSYMLMCENGAWWPPFAPRRRMYCFIPDSKISISFDSPPLKHQTRQIPHHPTHSTQTYHGIPLAYHHGAIYSRSHVAGGTLRDGASQEEVDALATIHGILIIRKYRDDDDDDDDDDNNNEEFEGTRRRIVLERVECFQIGRMRLDEFISGLGKIRGEECVVL